MKKVKYKPAGKVYEKEKKYISSPLCIRVCTFLRLNLPDKPVIETPEGSNKNKRYENYKQKANENQEELTEKF